MAKIKKKKLNLFYKVIIWGFIIGFLFAFLYHTGIFDKMHLSFKSVHWLWHISFFILIFFLTLTVHELGHLVSFVIQGIKIRALHIFILVIYRKKKGFRVAIDFKLYKLLGGLVVPMIGEIKTQEDYEEKVQKFKKALISGPNTTKVFMYLYLVVTFLVFAISLNYTLIGVLLSTSIWVVLWSILYIKSSKMHNDMFYGDYVAYDKMGVDPVFSFVQIDQYLIFNLKKDLETDDFMYQKQKSLIESHAYTTQIFRQALYLSFLNKDQIFEDEMTITIENRLSHMSNSGLFNKKGYDGLVSLICYHYLKGNDDAFYKLYMQFMNHKNEDALFYQKLVLHKLGFEDHFDDLMANQKIIIETYWIFKRIVDLDQLVEDTLEVLDERLLICDLICYL